MGIAVTATNPGFSTMLLSRMKERIAEPRKTVNFFGEGAEKGT
jgi:hypothetical protein